MILLGTLYRPRWALWFMIGLIPLETTTLLQNILPVSVRPYQIVAIALIIATAVNHIIRRKVVNVPKLSLIDYGVAMIMIGGLIPLSKGGDTQMLTITAALLSYGALYALLRVYITKLIHVRMPLIFITITSLLIALYGYIQNHLFLTGQQVGVMPGRPNATFPEADWLGMFLVFSLAITFSVYTWISEKCRNQQGSAAQINTTTLITLVVATTLTLVLILTVARSAWLGYAAVIVALLIGLMLRDTWRTFKASSIIIITSLAIALAGVFLLNLTRFDLIGRAASTGTGLQEITIACKKSATCTSQTCTTPDTIGNAQELKSIGCTHIDLEEITTYKQRDYIVTTTNRPDPNVNIRKEIYTQSFERAKESPLMGIGWGAIGEYLGEDDAGTKLNSSNIFLQVWLGSGALGLIGLLLITMVALTRSIRLILTARHEEDYAYGIYILLGGVAIIIPNMFNAGMLLGYIWLYLASTQINTDHKDAVIEPESK